MKQKVDYFFQTIKMKFKAANEKHINILRQVNYLKIQLSVLFHGILIYNIQSLLVL